MSAALLALSLTACSGPDGYVPSASTRANAGDSAVPATPVQAKLEVDVPLKASGRTFGGFSSSTRSVVLGYNQRARTFDIGPEQSACAKDQNFLRCGFAFAVHSGNQEFGVTAYSENGGYGAVLDRGSAKVRIDGGKANSVLVPVFPIVSTGADSGPGSLRHALTNARDGEIVRFLIVDRLAVQLARQIEIAAKVTLEGPGAGILTVANGGRGRIFEVTAPNAAFSGITFARGSENFGGAIYAHGSVDIRACRFVDNVAGGLVAAGGALYVRGHAAVSDTAFEHDRVLGDYNGDGGAAYVLGPATFERDTFVKNSASGGNASGGAIVAYGGLLSKGTRYASNRVAATENGAGGAIYAAGSAEIDDGVLVRNEVTARTQDGTAYGGAIVLQSGADTLTRVTIDSNAVSARSAYGGGIYLSNLKKQVVDVVASTIARNRAGYGGGIYSYGKLHIVNSTLASNAALVNGGGIELVRSAAAAIDVTLYHNKSSGAGGNVSVESGASLTIGNDIVAGGSSPSGPDIYDAGSAASLDYNVIQTAVAGNSLTGTTAHNVSGNPNLLGLADNGGPTQTNAESASSISRNLAPIARCLQFGVKNDQRGDPRNGPRCDAGAYQYQ